jgi:hypothetical protein
MDILYIRDNNALSDCGEALMEDIHHEWSVMKIDSYNQEVDAGNITKVETSYSLDPIKNQTLVLIGIGYIDYSDQPLIDRQQ